MTTIDPLSFGQDKQPYYHRGPFKIGSCRAWKNTSEEIQTCCETEAHSVSQGNHQKHILQTKQVLDLCLGFHTHIKRLIQNLWQTKQHCQSLYNSIQSRHLWKSTFYWRSGWGRICFTIMKFFCALTTICLKGSTRSLVYCVSVHMCFHSTKVQGERPGTQCSPLWEIIIHVHNCRTV